jgi:hypothetical protein
VGLAGGDAVTVHVETHGEVAIGGRAEPAIEKQALGGVDGEVRGGGFQRDGVAEGFEGAGEDVDPNIGAGAAVDVERSGGEKTDPHQIMIAGPLKW